MEQRPSTPPSGPRPGVMPRSPLTPEQVRKIVGTVSPFLLVLYVSKFPRKSIVLRPKPSVTNGKPKLADPTMFPLHCNTLVVAMSTTAQDKSDPALRSQLLLYQRHLEMPEHRRPQMPMVPPRSQAGLDPLTLSSQRGISRNTSSTTSVR